MTTLLLSMIVVSQTKPGLEMLQQWDAKLSKSKTLSGTLVVEGGPFSQEVTFELSRPNLGKVVSKNYEYYCDGLKLWDFKPLEKTYTEYVPGARPPYVSPFLIGYEAFNNDDSNWSYSSEKEATFKDVDAIAVMLSHKPASTTSFGKFGLYGAGFFITYYFNKATKTFMGYQVKVPHETSEVLVTGTVKNLAIDKLMKPAQFKWKPPVNAKLVTPINYDDLLLPIATKAPDFTLPSQDGKSIKLSDYVKERKVTVLTFWFDGCYGCMVEYPHFDKMYRTQKSKEIGVIGANPIDPMKTVTRYYTDGKFSFPCVVSKGSSYDLPVLYKIRAYPSNYLIGPDMKIIDRWTGEQEKRMKDNFAKLGVK